MRITDSGRAGQRPGCGRDLTLVPPNERTRSVGHTARRGHWRAREGTRKWPRVSESPANDRNPSLGGDRLPTEKGSLTYPFRTRNAPRGCQSGLQEAAPSDKTLQMREKADARTRTGDPFITRERRVRDGRPLCGHARHDLAGNQALPSDHYRGRACPRVPEFSYPFRTRDATSRVRDEL